MLRRIVIWLLWCLAVLVFIVTIGAASLWMMPWAVSTHWSKQQLETRVTRALHAPVTVDRLHWTWEEGIQIEGLRIADDKGFGRDSIISLDRLILNIDPVQLIDRRLYLDLRMEGLKAQLIRGPDGRTNLEAWLARMRPSRKAPAEIQASKSRDWREAALVLPGDLKAHISLEQGAVLVEDQQASRSLAIRDIALRVNIPSLLHKPVTVTLSSCQEMDGKSLPPVDLTLSVEHLVDSAPAVRLSAASMKARCRLPGLDLAVSGGLSDMGIEGKMDLDLAAIREAAGPLVPATLPAVSGRVGLSATARLGSGDQITYDVTLSGSRLAIEGGPFKDRRIGPVALHLSQTGTVAPKTKELKIVSGELQVQDKTRLQWQGQVRQTGASGLEADLTLDGIAVDLREAATLAGPFFPVGMVSGGSSEHPQGVTVEQIHLKGMLPAGQIRSIVKGLQVDLPGLNLAQWKGGLSVDGVHLRVSGADVQLQDRFPTSFEVTADLDVQKLSLSGGQAIHVHGLKVADVHVTARDLARSPKALLGMTGSVSLKESVMVEQVDAPGLAMVPGIRHDLKGSVLMQDRPPLMRLSARTAVETSSTRIDALSKRPIKAGVRLKTQIDDLDIAGLAPLMADVRHVDAALRLGDIVDFQLQGEAAALGEKALRIVGHTTLDLKGAGTLIPASLKPKGAFEGTLTADWRFEGRRPTPNELKLFSDRGLSFAQRCDALGFIKMAELRADLKDVGLNLPLKGGASLSVHRIRTVSPLSVTASSGLSSVQLEGNLAIGRVSQLPGSEAFKPPLQATLSYKVDEQDLTSLQMSEALHIDPLNIDQDLQFSLNRLNRLMNLKERPTLSTLLRRLDASVTAGLRTTLGPSMAPFTPGLSLSGPLKAGLGLDLSGGKEISAHVSLESKGLDVTLQQARVRGLTSHIHLFKTYGLQFEGEDKGMPGSPSPSLSQKVLRPSVALGLRSSPGNALARRLVEDLGGPISGPPAISFNAVDLMGSRFPLQLRNGELQLRLARSLPSLDRFQFDAIGGSILGDLRITRQDDLCGLEMRGAFSGLDTLRLLPEQPTVDRIAPRGSEQDTQVSGQVSLKMPVSRDSVRVMNNLSAGIHLTHIGSRTLERLLYAMDPYEANEGIVKQRSLLRKGTPEWVDLQIRHGNLSLSGSVMAMGAQISLPRVERLNLTNLPIHDRLQKVLARLGPVEKALKTLSADSILIRKDGSIGFVEDTP